MSEKVTNKGIKFVPASAISAEAKHKLDDLMKRKKKGLNKLVSDYNAGVLVPQS